MKHYILLSVHYSVIKNEGFVKGWKSEVSWSVDSFAPYISLI